MTDSLHMIWIPAVAALVIFVVTVSLLALADMYARVKDEHGADRSERR